VFEGWATAATFAGLVIAATVALRVGHHVEYRLVAFKPGQDTFSDLRDVDWCCLIPASFVQFADILLTNC
jgi:hypothetical protein